MGRASDEQFTPDELEMMGASSASAASANPPPSDEALADAAVAAPDDGVANGDHTEAADATAADASEQAAADATAESEPQPFVPQFDGSAPADYEQQRKAIREEKAQLRAKWSSGELSDDEWAQQEIAIDDRYEALREQYLVAQALDKANKQIQEQQQRETLQNLANVAKRAGVDYADPGIAALFDNRLNAVAAEDGFKGKPFAEIAAEANKRVLSLFGKAAAAPAQQTQQPGAKTGTKPSMRDTIPQTLANLPAAAAPQTGSDIDDQLAAIDDPDVLEARWAAMPASQRSAMLRSTLPARR
jgi:hypothetical protein